MGTGSLNAYRPGYSHHQYACLTINWSDRLRLIQFPAAIIDAVRQAILATWRRGIQNEKQYGGAYEFKLGGNPWAALGVDTVESRMLMMSILSALHHRGWHLLISTDVCRTEQDKDSLIFQRGAPQAATPFFAVSFNETDKLLLIGVPPELIPEVRQAIGTSEIQREEWVYGRSAYQFKLRGYPWGGNPREAVTARIKLLALVDCFASFGWQLHASIDMSTGRESGDTDTWFFRRIN